MVLTAARSTFTAAAVGVKIAMDDQMSILPIDVVPLQQSLSWTPIENIKQQWLNDALDTQVVDLNADSAPASATIVLVDSSPVRVGDVLRRQKGTLLVKVTANVYGTNTLTVTRPFAGSTDEALDGTPAGTDKLEIIGQDLVEGQDPPDPRDNDFVGDFNLTQIFEEAIQATRSAMKNDQYGVEDPYANAMDKKFRELNVRLERALIYGRRNQSSSTRQLGGFQYFLVSSLLNKSGVKANLEQLVGDMLQAAYDQGATPQQLFVSPAIKRVFSGLNSTLVTEDRADTGVGRTKTTYHSDFGDVTLTPNRYLDSTKGILVDTSLAKGWTFDEWFHMYLAKTGDTDKGMIVAEKSLEIKHATRAHGLLTVTDA